MKILLIGPQGSGKGTQAKKLANELGVEALSIGSVLRKHVKNNDDIGKEVKPYMDRGVLIPFDLNLRIVHEATDGKKGFILDGYPRNLKQARACDKLFDLDKVILLEVPDKVSIERIGGRRVCDNGHEYHIKYLPPKISGVCDKDGLKIHKRSDDEEQAIKQRLKIYHQQTEPVVRHYENKDLLLRIDGNQGIEEVFDEIKNKLNM